MIDLFDLVDGKIGKVIEKDDWDVEKECIVIEGKEYEIDEEVGSVDDFLEGKDLDKLILYRSDGYRGMVCYSGSMEVDGELYSLDIVNEYNVFKLKGKI